MRTTRHRQRNSPIFAAVFCLCTAAPCAFLGTTGCMCRMNLHRQCGARYGEGSWIGFLGTDINILLPQLHHTKRSESDLREAAAQLSRSFGLPGLPISRPDALAGIDLARSACVRAFMGKPRLLILNSSELEQNA